MKKVLASLLVICALLSCMIFAASAAAYDYNQGEEITHDFPAIWTIHFEPIDITGAVAVKFDFYIDKAADFKIAALEFGSHFKDDWQEYQFTGAGKWPELHDGWNTVTFEFANGAPVADANPNDGTDGTFDPKTFQRIRIFNTNNDDPKIKIGFRNIVAVKEDSTEIKVGTAPKVLDNGVLEGNVRTYAFELYQDSEDKYLIRTSAGDNGTQRFSDTGTETVYGFGIVDAANIEKVEFSAKLGCQLLLQVSNDGKNWVEVYKYDEVVPDHPEAGAEVKVYDFDLTDKWTKGDALYVRVADSSPENGWGGSIFKGNVNTLKVTYKSDAPVDPTPDDPAPATFDAVSSVAALAVAALGVALVASKKRH